MLGGLKVRKEKRMGGLYQRGWWMGSTVGQGKLGHVCESFRVEMDKHGVAVYHSSSELAVLFVDLTYCRCLCLSV